MRTNSHKVGPALLTGFAGFIGPHIAEVLISEGHSVVAVVRRRTVESDVIAKRLGVGLVVGDLADGHFLDGLRILPSSIINLAANTGARGEYLNVLHRDNVLSTKNLLHFAKQRDCFKFIHISSVSVHGRVDGGLLDRAQASHSPTVYGKTKLMAELCLKDGGSGINIVSLRLPGVLGPKSPQHLLTRLVEKAISGTEIEIHHAESLFNNVVHVDDLSRFIVHLVDKEGKSDFVAFPLASRDPIRMREVVNLVKTRTNSTSRVCEVTSSESSFFIDDSYARSVFGYESMRTRDAIARFVDSYYPR